MVGHRDVPGRPALYATTRDFLDDFNLKSLGELPSLAELRDIDSINAVLDLEPREKDQETTSDEEDIDVIVTLADDEQQHTSNEDDTSSEQTDTLH